MTWRVWKQTKESKQNGDSSEGAPNGSTVALDVNADLDAKAAGTQPLLQERWYVRGC